MKTVMITGANRGIGLELVKQYAADNDRVLACCRQPQAATMLQEIAGGSGGRIEIHPLDVTQAQDVEALKNKLNGEPIDFLINNAGISDSSTGEVDYEKWVAVLRVNTIAPYRISTAFYDNLHAGREKKIAVISSRMGSIAENDGGRPAYRSSKAAVNIVMKGLAQDYRSAGIAVFLLHPGWVRTDMGGSAAPVLPEDSARGLKQVIDQLSLRDTGRFVDYQGHEIPW